jgi:hypothetical protein
MGSSSICYMCVSLKAYPTCNVCADNSFKTARDPRFREMLGFSCVAPIKTVHGLLESHGALGLLRDPLIATPTQVIGAEKKTRREI